MPAGRPRKINLEVEAAKFVEQKKQTPPPRPMTTRRQYIAAAMSGLLARSSGLIDLNDLRVESERIADYLLENET